MIGWIDLSAKFDTDAGDWDRLPDRHDCGERLEQSRTTTTAFLKATGDELGEVGVIVTMCKKCMTVTGFIFRDS